MAIKIYGAGMLATAFQGKSSEQDVVVIAAGVSNSQEQQQQEFLREELFLLEILNKHNLETIVYFSSCSVYQKKNSPYINHKLKMERLIQSLATSFYIFRLPQVVGFTNNTTIVSYFVQCLLQNVTVTVQKNAFRSLIDVDDVVRIVLLILNNILLKNSVIDVTNVQTISVHDLLTKISKIIDSVPSINLIDDGEAYEIPSKNIKKILLKNDRIFSEEYYDIILGNYVPKILLSISSGI
ncbi:NAD-dependent epimerase/dehydratase family protein [Shewanella frigidimarina]|uniref:NAD-dependent epimerase/dehydratase family protein n=1 Tax=Shewanella frigidimarina TaxID=56812 RepID=UPI003D79C3B3